MFSTSSATLNVYDKNGSFLYATIVPREVRSNFHLYETGGAFAVGTGYDGAGRNERFYLFDETGYLGLDKGTFEAEPSEQKSLVFHQVEYHSDWFGNYSVTNLETSQTEIQNSNILVFLKFHYFISLGFTLICLYVIIVPFIYGLIDKKKND